jgi:two-component system phosphate regulon sensor histidine kinase PhoR
MNQRRLLWYLFPSYLIITIIALIAATIYAYYLLSKNYIEVISTNLNSDAQIVENQVKRYLLSSEYAVIDSLFNNLGKKINTRFTISLPEGRVIADSEKDPSIMDNHHDRPEIIQALQGKIGTSIRYSQTLDAELIYVAVPIYHEDEIIGVLRTSVPLLLIEQTLAQFQTKFIIAGLIITIIIGLLSLYLSRRISKPLEDIQLGVEKFADGELSFRIKEPSSTEMGKLSSSLNQMASQLDEKIKTIVEQKNEQEAVLESMVEGVIAVDNDGKILNLNQTAAKLFHIDVAKSVGKHIYEIINFKDLVNLIKRILKEKNPGEQEIILEENQTLYLQVNGAVLKNAQEKVIGAVIVLNNVTRLRRLEKVRRDFVANVSHEIRTPLTTIKGFAETLLDSASKDPKNVRGFLKIISRQSDRLNAIIEDLLILARLEQEDERVQIEFNRISLNKVLKSAMKVCAPAADKKDIEFILDAENNLSPRINPDLLEQAIVNLVDNAIKYSAKQGQVKIKANLDNSDVVVSVTDSGRGIPDKHLPRIFERFYRVDKARSREQGGTGLGLSIVKHITQVHGGRVKVRSEIGKGSTFSIYIPYNKIKIQPEIKKLEKKVQND